MGSNGQYQSQSVLHLLLLAGGPAQLTVPNHPSRPEEARSLLSPGFWDLEISSSSAMTELAA